MSSSAASVHDARIPHNYLLEGLRTCSAKLSVPGFFEFPKVFEVLAPSSDLPNGVYLKLTPESYIPPHEPINARAWTLEERLLSQRLVIFSFYGPIWECPQGKWAFVDEPDAAVIEPSQGSKRITSGYLNQYQRDPGHFTIEVPKCWNKIVEDYSSRALSRPDDKLPAIAGIAEEFAQVWVGTIFEVLLASEFCIRSALLHLHHSYCDL